LLRKHANHLIAALPKDKTVFDIQELFFRLTLDSATEFLFGESVNSLSSNFSPTSGPLAACGGEKGFAHAFTLSLDYLICRGWAQNLYWLINPPRFHRAVKIVHDVVDYYVDRVLEAKSKLKDQISSNENKRYVFLEALAEETQDRKTLRDQLINILLAGRDTTASLLASSFYYLARHPNVWSRLRQEITEAFPIEEKDSITLEKLREVKYLRYFLNEGKGKSPLFVLSSFIAKKNSLIEDRSQM
jgi:cytochrome P450